MTKKQTEFDKLLAETEAKLTQGEDYYETEEFEVGDGQIPINYKPLSQAVYSKAVDQPKELVVPYILSNTLYNPETKKLYTQPQLQPMFDMLGGLTYTIANVIVEKSGFDPKKLKQKQIPSSKKRT